MSKISRDVVKHPVAACCLVQILNALDVVNRNLAKATESWSVCRKEIVAMQRVVNIDDISLLTENACSEDTAIHQMHDFTAAVTSLRSSAPVMSSIGDSVSASDTLESSQQCSQQTENTASQSSQPDEVEHLQSTDSGINHADEISHPITEAAESVDKGDRSNMKLVKSSAKVSSKNRAVTRQFSEPQPLLATTPKRAVGLQKNVASKSPKKTDDAVSPGKKVGSATITSRKSSLPSQKSVDLSRSRSSAPLSSRVSGSNAVNSSTRRPSVSKQFTLPTSSSISRQQSEKQRKSSTISTSSSASLPNQETTSESSLAAGDFTAAVTSLRSSTPVMSSTGDSVSRVSSVSDASSLSASHGSMDAFSASAFKSPKLPSNAGELLRVFVILTYFVSACEYKCYFSVFLH